LQHTLFKSTEIQNTKSTRLYFLIRIAISLSASQLSIKKAIAECPFTAPLPERRAQKAQSAET
jgi:hypothetical protein